jgi:hypothetical protein
MQAQLHVLWKPKLMDEHKYVDGTIESWMEKIILSIN